MKRRKETLEVISWQRDVTVKRNEQRWLHQILSSAWCFPHVQPRREGKRRLNSCMNVQDKFDLFTVKKLTISKCRDLVYYTSSCSSFFLPTYLMGEWKSQQQKKSSWKIVSRFNFYEKLSAVSILPIITGNKLPDVSINKKANY